MKDGFIRCASASPKVKVADCKYNAEEIISMIKESAENDCSLIVFPELSVTGCSCGDLFLSDVLIKGAAEALKYIISETKNEEIVFAAGLPVLCGNKLYNCAAVCSKGKLLGLVPKTNIPSFSELYQTRYFSAYTESDCIWCESLGAYMGQMLFKCSENSSFTFGVEICEDMQAPLSPSVHLVQSGAAIICSLSASAELVGRHAQRKKLADAQSSKLICGYIYADCGEGESTQDNVYGGCGFIYENGSLLAERKPFGDNGIIYADIDLNRLSYERRKTNIYEYNGLQIDCCGFSLSQKALKLQRHFPKNPFIPENEEELSARCEEILRMQAAGLASRMKHIGCKSAVLGLSGGLDSTLALIVTVHAYDMLGLDRKDILAVTMPCFGTTQRTKNNALILAETYGTSIKEINIAKSVRQHFEDIGHDESCHDVTYENSQARERTQVIMDIANQIGGIVIGTGDLSELALGWATYNGDHMSMYGVNASIPKTLVRRLVEYEAHHTEGKLSEALLDVLDTPVSPELLPPSSDGTIAQKTEDIVGPYELHDFFLFYMLRYGFSPAKIYRMAQSAFDGVYGDETILKWLRTFTRRFFTQQFKRSCLPDGPAVGSVGLSPRSSWRMPTDASMKLWMDELDSIN